jgi:UDP-N-acetylglucosamine 2-epimerase (non-hydrolysing)
MKGGFKVVTLVGTRPELIKLSLTIAELDRSVEHVLVHTGQNNDFELNEVFFRDLGIRKPDHFLSVAAATPAATIAQVIERFDAVLERENPDAMLLLGDTNSCLGVIVAKRRKIPIFHMEAGNRCFDDRVPEEINRRIVDHTSDINLPYTEHARRYLIAEGLPAERIIKTGSPMTEILRHFRSHIDASGALAEHGLARGGYFVVSAHREENVDIPERLNALIDALNALVAEHDAPLVFSTHPRTRQRLEALGDLRADARIRFVKPLGFFDYVRLQLDARCVISDSGTLTEESAILGFPGVMIREAHERPEGMDEGTVVMSALTRDSLRRAVALVSRHGAAPRRLPADYAADDVSSKITRIILSYTDFVNRTVWSKGPAPRSA